MSLAKLKVNPNFGGMLTIGHNPILCICKADHDHYDDVPDWSVMEIHFIKGDERHLFQFTKKDVNTIIKYLERWIK